MAARKKPAPQNNSSVDRYHFDCVLTEATNPVTGKRVRLNPPVKIIYYADVERFNGQWEKFCKEVTGPHFDPDDVVFELELAARTAGPLSW